jgi:hypothetical protein
MILIVLMIFPDSPSTPRDQDQDQDHEQEQEKKPISLAEWSRPFQPEE